MKRNLVLIGSLMHISSLMLFQKVEARELTMICENPRREYQVRYSGTDNSFDADDTPYRILAVEETDDRLIVVGLTVDQGPTFRAHFRPYKKMEYFTDNQLFQTDGCR